MEYLSILFSAAFLGCMTTLLLSCATCKRIFKKKKDGNKDDDDEEKAEVIHDNQDEEKKKENGISNQAYTETHNQAEVITVTVENEEEIKNDCQKESNDNENIEEKVNTEVTTDVEVTTTNTEVDGGSNSNVNKSEQTSAVAEEQNKDGEKNTSEAASDSAECEAETNQLDSTEQTTPISKNNLHTFSESIRSNDIADLSMAINEVHETIVDTSSSTLETAPVASSGDLNKYKDVVIPGGWRRDVKLTDLLEMGLIDTNDAEEVLSIWQKSNLIEETSLPPSLKPYLYGESPVAGIILSETEEKKSIFRAAKDGILRRGAAISLLEAQAATGNIIDPISGRKMSVAEACELGLLDKIYETVVSRAERAVTGYKSKALDETLSLGQAMERGLVIESHGIRLLEAQLATGGIIDHKANIKVPTDVAIKRGLLDEKLAEKLLIVVDENSSNQNSEHLKTFFDPNTEENVTYRELMMKSIVEEETGIRLYPLDKLGRKRFNYTSYSGRSSLASSRASSKESIPAAVAASP